MPREIRDIIYEMALTCDVPIPITDPNINRESRCICRRIWSLFYVNKQIYSEAAPIFYSVNDFMFGDAKVMVDRAPSI